MRLRCSLPYVLLDVYGGCSLKPLQNFIFLIVIKNKFLKFQLVIFFFFFFFFFFEFINSEVLQRSHYKSPFSGCCPYLNLKHYIYLLINLNLNTNI